MIRLLRRFTAAALAAAIVLAAPGTSALAAEVRVGAAAEAASAGSGSAAAGASVVAPLSLTPSPWNPSAPTVMLAAPVPALAPAIGAASMPPVIGAASMPPLAAPAPLPAAAAPVAAPANAAPSATAQTGTAKATETKDGSKSRPSRVSKAAEKLASWFGAKADGSAELPPPADAVDSLAQASVTPDPKRAYHASPADWRDETLYSIVMDRFAKSKRSKGVGDPKDGVSRHGGDIRGIIEKLDYIKASGATTLLVSPVTMSVPEAYHGYAPVHFLAVDPRFGTMADFKELVAKAHEKGLKVVLDWVINHSGPVFEYSDGKTQWTGDGKPGPVEWTRKLKPVEFDENDFSRKRVITDWNNNDQATQGDFPPNYRHFATDRVETQDKLIHVVQWWMKETDIDGLRLDAVRHVAPGFLPRFSREIRGYAAKLGKKNFLMLGENSTGVDGELKPYLENGSLDTLYDYPAYRRENAALHGAAPTRVLEDSRAASQSALGAAADRLLRFIDLHDTYRFLLSDTPGQILKTALAFLMLGAGIPIIYYGTEQAFRQLHGRLTPEGGDLPADPQNREDMFAEGKYKSESSAGDKFDQGSESFKFVRALAELRRAYPALTRGEQFTRWSDPNGAGIYAFSRIHEGHEILVVLNTAGESRDAEMFVDSGVTPPGSLLTDAFQTGYAMETHGSKDAGSKISVRVPAYGVRVMVRAQPK